jgi:hypothetical protein
MLNIRAVSYGALYSFSVQCPDCRAKWDHQIDLTKDLEIRDISDDWQDPFEIELPSSRDVVTLKLFRGEDERSIINYVDRQNKKVNLKSIGDPGYTYSLALHVVGVKSNSNPAASFDEENCKTPGSLFANATSYVENLTGQDSSVVREEIDDRTPGVKLSMEMECPKCRNEFDLVMPLQADFFRSTQSTSRLRTSTGTVPRQTR